MPILTIRETCLLADNAGFAATLSIDHQTQYEITVHDPFDARKERELEFYFEQWIKFPFDNQVIAKRAAESVTTYGEALFEQVFAHRKAYSAYETACQNGLSKLQIEIIGDSPDFQALHWEALKDPDLPRPLAVDCVMIRKRFRDNPVEVQLKSSPTINLLVVTARPKEDDDIGYRTISRPLIEAIHKAQLRVNVEILRPGTFEALLTHLSQKEKEGHYHIVHFDVHGALLTYEQCKAGIEADRYLYQARTGQQDIKPYDGVKAFLFLEGKEKDQFNPVEAQDLADLLTGKGIPICILNACQSGKQLKAAGKGQKAEEETEPAIQNPESAIQNSETSLGSRLMAAGVQMVVAMGYSVTVTAAALMMEKLYGQLFAQQGIPEAIRLGRKELYNQKNRRVYFNQIVELEDWLLPVVYANRDVDLKLREFQTIAEEEAYYAQLEDLDERYQFAEPLYGFIGRDLDILKIEKALLRHNILLLRGMGGTGKTTLLKYLWRWWLTTNFVEDAFYFGYDEKAHTVQQIVHEIGKRVYDRDEHARFLAMSESSQVTKLAKTLCERRCVLILDNLESITGQALAIQNTLPEAEQQKLRQFLLKLARGETKVVLGSRGGEEWLAAAYTEAGKANVYPLAGLDPESRTVLAEKILDAQVGNPQRIAALRKDDGFKRLMKLLAGYPLAMEVVLANLANQSPQQILDGLQAADVDLNVGGGDKTNNILKCVEYSHSNLSPDAQKLLVCLAPFNSFINRADLENYGKQLQQREPFKDYDFGRFDEAIQEAIQWGLLSGMNLDGSPLAPLKKGGERLLSIQPIFPYFLRTKLNELDAATRDALYDGFKAHYQGLASNYQQLMDSKNPQERQLGLLSCRLEYENLYSVLKICLKNQESISIFFCLFQFFYINKDIQSAIKLSEFVCEFQGLYPHDVRVGKIGFEIVQALDRLAYCYRETQNCQQARSIYRRILEVIPKLLDVSDAQKKSGLAKTYFQLGRVVEELREYEQARSYYQQALNIFIEFDERHLQATVYHELGVIAQELRDYAQARSHYEKALGIYVELNDRYEQSGTYHQLGNIFYLSKDYKKARSHYQKSLDIKIEFNDRHRQANTYHQLGIVAQELKDYKQARSHLHQALGICVEFNDRRTQATVYHQLGIVAKEIEEYEQARLHLHQALDLFIEFNDRYSQASTYHQLGNVAQGLREYEQARSHYQKALDIKIDFNDRYSQASTYFQLAKVFEATGNLSEAMSCYLQDLQITAEFNDEHGLGISMRNLARFYREHPDEKFLAQIGQCLNATLDDMQQLFAKFNRNE